MTFCLLNFLVRRDLLLILRDQEIRRRLMILLIFLILLSIPDYQEQELLPGFLRTFLSPDFYLSGPDYPETGFLTGFAYFYLTQLIFLKTRHIYNFLINS